MAHFQVIHLIKSGLHIHPPGGQAKWPDVGSSVIRPAAAVALRRADAQRNGSDPVPPVRLRAAVLGGDAGIIELEKVGKVGGFTLESWKRWRFNYRKSWNFGIWKELPIGINNYLSTIHNYPHM